MLDEKEKRPAIGTDENVINVIGQLFFTKGITSWIYGPGSGQGLGLGFGVGVIASVRVNRIRVRVRMGSRVE